MKYLAAVSGAETAKTAAFYFNGYLASDACRVLVDQNVAPDYGNSDNHTTVETQDC
ncbi:hypothetical protein L2719_02025 [Shewanella schlegeliana]|uniref:Uncharacterized protein n=1 Tax=Shewanella schlegeliana TaxID=190308 RepID=A0ABS1SY53_9GAMM|nr:hypothetical protein [Shewanella schlegeliana]MBL4913454.1 hypothetical protein [Shewanella schlegeliana]MCL1108344.1 hypothetical protein [Shewanella schlegeliana]GIU34345.1 hypothetical protein TUM4433_30310 [Shewanella schlegeliana]